MTNLLFKEHVSGTHPSVYASVDLNALRENYMRILTGLPDATGVAAVVKSDAYGHGMIECSRVLDDLGARFLIVSSVMEALQLREAGVEADVLILGPVLKDESVRVVENDFSVAVGSFEQASFLAHTAQLQRKQARAHLMIDTGMGRFGILYPLENSLVELERIMGLDGLKVEGVMTHFTEADDPHSDFTAEQSRRFRQILRLLEQEGLRPEFVHASNTGGVLFHPNTAFSLVRVGIGLYGASPDPAFMPEYALKPVMSGHSFVADLRNLPEGFPVSYGRTYVTKRKTRAALVMAGYGDGYPRVLSNRGEVVVRDRRLPILGRVTMNLIVVDATDMKNIKIGDPVLLFGSDGQSRLRVEELAASAQTIAYEILCHFGRSTHRVYIEGES